MMQRAILNFRPVLAVLMTCLITACGGGGSAPVTPPAPPVPAAPLIATQPASVTIGRGGTATFTVAATGDGTLSYRWHRDGVDMLAGNSPTLFINTELNPTPGVFSVAVTNAVGTTMSQNAKLTVLDVKLQSSAATGTVAAGTTVTYSVTGSGTPQSYQWQRNDANIAGATQPTYSLQAGTADSGSRFTVALTYADGLIKPPAHTLAVGQALPATVLAGILPPAPVPDSGINLTYPGFALHPAGGFILSNHQQIIRVDAAGKSTSVDVTLPGTAYYGNCYRGNPAIDSAGTIFWADGCANVIRKLSNSGQLSIMAGAANTAGAADGAAGTARFNQPAEVVLAPDGALYVADKGNHAIRRIATNGDVTTVAGSAATSVQRDGSGSAAGLERPQALALDAAGNLYFADYGVLRKMTPNGVVTTIAGQAGRHGGTDGTGSAARFYSIDAIAVDRNGTIWVADNDEVYDADRSQYDAGQRADVLNNNVRQVTAGGVVKTIAGRWDISGVPSGYVQTRLYEIKWLGLDAQGAMLAKDRYGLQKIAPGAAAQLVLGSVLKVTAGFANGQGGAARFDGPTALAVDAGGNVLAVDPVNNAVRQITPGGLVSQRAALDAMLPGAGVRTTRDLLIHPANGDLLVVYANRWAYSAGAVDARIARIAGNGTVSTVWEELNANNSPTSIAFDRNGTLYAAFVDARAKPGGCTPATAGCAGYFNRGSIVRFGADGKPTLVAGNAGEGGSNDGVGSAARFGNPKELQIDADGNMYVIDAEYSTIRKITPAGVVTTLAGSGPATVIADGTGTAAAFVTPQTMVLGTDGNLYVGDGSAVRRVTREGQVTTLTPTTGIGEIRGIAFGANNTLYVSVIDAIVTLVLPGPPCCKP
jgi:sugar lactone lactonase YvrE